MMDLFAKGDNSCCCGMGQRVRKQHETQLYAVAVTVAKKQWIISVVDGFDDHYSRSLLSSCKLDRGVCQGRKMTMGRKRRGKSKTRRIEANARKQATPQNVESGWKRKEKEKKKQN